MIIPTGTKNPSEFELQIYLRKDIIGFVSPFFRNVEGERVDEFRETVLRLSSFLDIIKFAISPRDGKSIVLQAEYYRRDLSRATFTRIIKKFGLVYIRWWPEIVKLIHKYQLREREKSPTPLNSYFKKFRNS